MKFGSQIELVSAVRLKDIPHTALGHNVFDKL